MNDNHDDEMYVTIVSVHYQIELSSYDILTRDEIVDHVMNFMRTRHQCDIRTKIVRADVNVNDYTYDVLDQQ